MKERYRVKPLILCSFFAALTGVCSIVSIPLPFSPVPVNLALLSVYLAGGLLGPKNGAISQFVYILLGAAGLPVFHNLTGGLSILAGPTGGFLAGYIAAAFLVGFFYFKKMDKGLIIGLVGGLSACYALGVLWFMLISGAGLKSALLLCIIPFLPGDALKIIAAIFLIRKLRPFMSRYN
jgi:biotin transport system substrate-specific component